MKELFGIKKAIFFISFPLSFIGFVLPIYALKLGASPVEIGGLYSVFFLFTIIVRPITGYWIDKRGRRGIFILGLICYVTVIMLFLVGNSYKYILLARVIQSIASSFIWISGYAMISDVTDSNEIGKTIGTINGIANKGSIMGSLIGFTILFNGGFKQPFKHIFSIYLITSAIGLYYGLIKTSETFKNDVVFKQKSIAIRDNRFVIFLIVLGCMSFSISMLSPIYLMFLQENIIKDLSLISFIFIPSSVLSIYLPKIFGTICDKYGKKKMLVLGMILQSLFVVIIPYFKNYFIFMILYTLLSISTMIRLPAQTALVTELTGGDKRGKNYGLYSFSTGIGAVFGPLLGTVLYQYVDKKLVFHIQGLVFILCALVLIYLTNKNSKIVSLKYE